MKRLILTLFVGLLCFTYQAKAQWTVIDPVSYTHLMDYLVAPISADRVVMESTLNYAVVVKEHIMEMCIRDSGRNTQRPLFAVLFADIDPFQRLGIVSPAFQFADCLKLRFWGFP